MAVNTEEQAAVKVTDFDSRELHPDYRGWRGDREQAAIALKTASELIKKGKVDEILLAQQPVDGPFGMLELEKDDKGFHLLERKRSSIDRDSFVTAFMDERRGEQTAVIRLTTSESQPKREEKFVDVVNRLKEYEGMIGVTKIEVEVADPNGLPADVRRVVYTLVAEKNEYGWVERWGARLKGFALGGKKIPVKGQPISVIDHLPISK